MGKVTRWLKDLFWRQKMRNSDMDVLIREYRRLAAETVVINGNILVEEVRHNRQMMDCLKEMIEMLSRRYSPWVPGDRIRYKAMNGNAVERGMIFMHGHLYVKVALVVV